MSSVPARTWGWLPTRPDDVAVDAREAADDVHRPQLVDLEEVAVVDDLGDDLLHVVGLVGRVRDEVDDPLAAPVGVGPLGSKYRAGPRGCCGGRNERR